MSMADNSSLNIFNLLSLQIWWDAPGINDTGCRSDSCDKRTTVVGYDSRLGFYHTIKRTLVSLFVRIL